MTEVVTVTDIVKELRSKTTIVCLHCISREFGSG